MSDQHESFGGSNPGYGESLPPTTQGPAQSPQDFPGTIGPSNAPAHQSGAAPMYSAPAQAQVVPKNPGLAAALSALWAGFGQIYNGQIGLGLALMVVQFINLILAFVLIGIFTGLAVWIFGIYNAYTEAQKFNSQHGIIS